MLALLGGAVGVAVHSDGWSVRKLGGVVERVDIEKEQAVK